MTITLDDTIVRRVVAKLRLIAPDDDEAREVAADLAARLAPQRLRYRMKEFLALPKVERDRVLEAQVNRAAPLYNADLALPPLERELTAFTALDDFAPILEPEEYMDVFQLGSVSQERFGSGKVGNVTAAELRAVSETAAVAIGYL